MDNKVDVDKMEGNNQMNDLQFQDISHTVTMEQGNTLEEYNYNEDDDKANLLGPGDDADEFSNASSSGKKSVVSMFSFDFYQAFFEVDTPQVLDRMKCSFVPFGSRRFLEDSIRPNPDLYGPFWICITLIFTSAIAGNITSYLQSRGFNNQWEYDFNKVTLAASVIFGYWWLMSSILWAGHRWRSNSPLFTFIEVICIYGYSLTIFIPVSMLCVIQLVWMQWLLISIGTLLSGAVLVKTLWPALAQNSNKFTYIGATVILIMHLLLALVFKLYFFETVLHGGLSSTTTITPITKLSTSISSNILSSASPLQ